MAVHPPDDVADVAPRVEPAVERGEGGMAWCGADGDEAQSCTEHSTAFVKHALLNHLIRPRQQRRRDRQAEGFGGLEIDD